MSEARTGEFIRRAADWLRLAAAPTFAAMALYTSVSDSGPTAMLCSVAQHPSSLSGMVPMYLLMGAFHFPPWLRLISSRRSNSADHNASAHSAAGDRKSVVQGKSVSVRVDLGGRRIIKKKKKKEKT